MKKQSRCARFDRLAHGSAIGEFNCVDARTMQHQRQEMADARLFIDHIAKWCAVRGKRGRFDGGLTPIGVGWRLGRRLGHAVLAHSNQEKCQVLRDYSSANFVNYAFPAEAQADLNLGRSVFSLEQRHACPNLDPSFAGWNAWILLSSIAESPVAPTQCLLSGIWVRNNCTSGWNRNTISRGKAWGRTLTHASQDFADNPPPVVCGRSCRYDASEKAVAAQFAFRRDLVFVRRLGLLCMGHMTLSLRCSSLYSITLSATKSPAPSHDISMVRGHDRVAVALSESRGPAAQFAKNRCNASIASFRHDPREKWEGPIGD